MTSTREACWLLRCTGFGAAPLEVQRLRRLPYEEAVEQRLAEPRLALDEPMVTRIPAGQVGTLLQLSGMIRWWTQRLSQGCIREKMTLFWHGYFTSSLDPVFSAGLLLCQNQLLRANALGHFEDLLQQVSRDPAMLIYLDGFRNKPEHPNENFAREVMEMFTTGPGHYSEEDLRQAARAFTGWEVAWLRGAQFRENPAAHDSGPKRFKNLIGQLDGQQVLHHLARDPATARHVCGKLWEFFTALPAPPGEIERLAGVFEKSHGHMGVVLKRMLLGQAFRQAAQPRKSVKSPLEFCLEIHQVLQRDWHWTDGEELKRMGQLPFLPPSVAGWRQGEGWIDTSTLQRRLHWVQKALKQDRQRIQQVTEQVAGLGRADGIERWLWLTHQLDAGPELRGWIGQHYRNPEILQLILSSPEVQLR